MLEVLDYGGRLVILEFSRPTNPIILKAYKSFSGLWPKLGKFITGDESSYKYLVESIQMHPDQDTMNDMISRAGFKNVEVPQPFRGNSSYPFGSKDEIS